MNNNTFEQHSLWLIVGGVVTFLLLGAMMQHSRLWSNPRYWVPLLVGLTLIGFGALFKILHWASADWQLLVGAAILLVTYALWFRAKKDTSLLACLKLAWVISLGLTVTVLSLYPPLTKPLAGVANALLWAMTLRFVYQRWIRSVPPNAE